MQNFCTLKQLIKPVVVKSVHGISKLYNYIIEDVTISMNTISITLPQVQLILLEESPYEIIIGLQDIRKYDLTTQFRPWFTEERAEVMQSQESALVLYQPSLETSAAQTSISNSKIPEGYTVMNREHFIPSEDQYDPMDVLEKPNIWDDYFNEAQLTSKTDDWQFIVHGSNEEKEQLLTLLEEFRDVFATSVSREPAKVTPYRFEVDEQLWTKEKGTRFYARPQSEGKRQAMRAFLTWNLTC